MDKPAVTDHPIHPPLATRWSPVAFADAPVSDEDLAGCFEAARWTASCFNAQPWAFVVATADDAERHGAFVQCLVSKNQGWAAAAPVIFFAVALTRFSHNDTPNRWAAYDVGAAVSTLAVEATTRGLVLHQMGGFDAEAVREVCALPEHTEVMAAVALGHPGSMEGLSEALQGRQQGARSRKPQSGFVFRGHWG